MNIKITGKDLKATEAIKDYTEKKLTRLVKYFDTEDLDASVIIRTERESQIAEINVSYRGDNFRAVTEHKDLYASIDKDIEILEGQIRKSKTKRDKQNMIETIRMNSQNSNESVSNEGEIIKTIYYSIKPLTAEDAKLILESDPKNKFLPFINVETNNVNVIYKLKDGKNFGILEPEN